MHDLQPGAELLHHAFPPSSPCSAILFGVLFIDASVVGLAVAQGVSCGFGPAGIHTSLHVLGHTMHLLLPDGPDWWSSAGGVATPGGMCCMCSHGTRTQLLLLLCSVRVLHSSRYVQGVVAHVIEGDAESVICTLGDQLLACAGVGITQRGDVDAR